MHAGSFSTPKLVSGGRLKKKSDYHALYILYISNVVALRDAWVKIFANVSERAQGKKILVFQLFSCPNRPAGIAEDFELDSLS